MISCTQKHEKEDIFGICTDLQCCDPEKKICKKCIQGSHKNHFHEVISIDEISRYAKTSNYLITTLKSQYEGLEKLCQHILQVIKQSLQNLTENLFDEQSNEIDAFIVNLKKSNQFMLKQMIVTESLHKLAFKTEDNIRLTFQQYRYRQRADEFWQEGYSSWKKGQYQEALMRFDLALFQDQNHFDSLYWKSSLLLNHLNDPISAKPIIKQALEIKPKDDFLLALQKECISRLDK